jgi:hypothetical protein
MSVDKRMSGVGSIRRFERQSDFRLTAEKIMGNLPKNDSKAQLPPLGRDPSKNKLDKKINLKTTLGQGQGMFATNEVGRSSLESFDEIKRRGYDS